MVVFSVIAPPENSWGGLVSGYRQESNHAQEALNTLNVWKKQINASSIDTSSVALDNSL